MKQAKAPVAVVVARAPLRCWCGEMLLDADGAPSSLCPTCDEVELVDVVRQLYRRKR